MADLDTRSKRASSVQILLSPLMAPVLPDGTINQGDRQHIAWSYSGIAAGGAAAGPASLQLVNNQPLTSLIDSTLVR